ncbi:unnamed protein product (macronuclear) [Paramecium tetraurelia]|uniref:Enkurin domain-containing protein n=1 Tax=Paramecium tetraurelia TaxID=5888 RepID=A0BWX7_PARTE|nr:uncharacterized protein GSPATT00032896001 [Paramecium tetraurelia]CAK63044.1 unnamed protein product [Paramecium tetraurelia]|eukprot:XP_001430442.1 hypothetical protein (macronuclear) [Paramecium tetraurelia strain d4-2]
MKADSFHSVLSDKHSKYNQFINSQLFVGYKVRGKDQQKKQYIVSSPSDEQKMSNNLTVSQSYVNAMKALQEKIKQLEFENQSLQSLVTSNDSKSNLKSNERKLKESSVHLKTSESLQTKELEQKLMQQEFTAKMRIEDYECKITQLQQNLLNITQQADQKYREYIEEKQNLIEQLRIQEENNTNYRNKMNSQNQSLQQEKQNYSHLQFLLEQEKNEKRFLQQNNEKLQLELSKLKEKLFEADAYIEQYTDYYNESIFRKLEEENNQLKFQLEHLTKENQQLNDAIENLKSNLDIKTQELEESEFRRVKKSSESNIRIEQLRQQLITLSSKSNLTTISPRVTKKKNIKQISSKEMSVKASKIRDLRQIKSKSLNKLKDPQFLTQSQSMQNNNFQNQKQQGYDSQSSGVSRLIVKTLEENYPSSQKNDLYNNAVIIGDEITLNDQQLGRKNQKYVEAVQRIRFLDELLTALNLQYQDIEEQIQQQTDMTIKKEKRQKLLEIIDQIQDVNKELNDLVTIKKLAQQQ